ncbi:MAG: carbohydrate ABC transporter permease [Candidatus Ornithospirochaeta sp.]|nr:sugar ABC transporter permease [Spirochaetales bacterium]
MKKKRVVPFLYLIPALGLLIAFMYYPTICNLIYSFLKWDLFKGTKKFIGFKNYIDLFKDDAFYVALGNNIKYVVISVFFQVFVALIFAARIEQMKSRTASTMFRTIAFIPSLISLTVIGLLFSFIYKSDGLLNSLLSLFGSPVTKGWLGDAKTAIYAIIAVSQWKSIGYTMMLIIVAIQRISKEQYEAAIMDGASRIQQFKYVTVPLIRDMLGISMVINISGGFLVFNEIFVMTNGGPHGSSEVLSTIMYKNAFTHGKVGYASAISIVLMLVSMFFFAIQQKISKKED